MIKNTKWTRKCPNSDNNPNCREEIFYTRKGNKNEAEKEDRNCISCAKKGKNHPMYGKTLPDEHRKKISKSQKGKTPWNKGKTEIYSEEAKQKMSESHIGIPRSEKTRKRMSESHKGKTLSEEHRKNMRLSAIKKIEKSKFNGNQMTPGYNSNAIFIIEQKAKELKITDLRHAENGGEFHIKELGYWVDGYSKEKNIVIEYYEPFHKKQKERDKRRKQEIINHLGCEFIELGVKNG